MRKDKIGIGVIGTGFARTTQLPAFRACPGARLVAVASAHIESAERTAREFAIPNFYSDWRAVIDHPEVDLVSIVTPVSTHIEMALAALDAGKAVLCEKPMAMTAVEADMMCQRAANSGCVALIDHELRFVAGRKRAREIVRAGEIGVVRHASLMFRSDLRATTAKQWDWWSDHRSGGGALGAIGSHAIDAFRWILGTEVRQVFCNLNTHISERLDHRSREMKEVTTDDEASMLLRFVDSELTERATGTVTLSMVEAGKPEHRLELYGSLGALRIEEGGELWRARVGSGSWTRVSHELGDTAKGMRVGGWSRGFTAFSRELIVALWEGETTVPGAATFDDGYRIQLVLDAARRSDQTGCVVTL